MIDKTLLSKEQNTSYSTHKYTTDEEMADSETSVMYSRDISKLLLVRLSISNFDIFM